MDVPILYPFKRRLRIWDSHLARKTREVRFRGHSFRFYSTFWWSDVSQSLLETEIVPYFSALDPDFSPAVIVDVGAATGHFAVLAAKLFPKAVVYAFEPSERQRVLLVRNARLNKVENITVQPFGLWNCQDTLAFRTNGAESSFESTSRFRGHLSFPEKVSVEPLDFWARENQIENIDLIKMDAEGAEIEILEGTHLVLTRDHPRLLIQAYHLRDGARTFEPCSRVLQTYGYATSEIGSGSGFLYARK